MLTSSVRVLLTCTGVGRVNRGIETFFSECFGALHNRDPKFSLRLISGAGNKAAGVTRAWSLDRRNPVVDMVGKAFRRNGYVVEQWSSFPSVVAAIQKFRPHVVFYSDANLGFLLHRFRGLIDVPYKLLFSNGGPVHPPFTRHDFVHQVAPAYYREALEHGEPPARHILVPYGFNVPSQGPPTPAARLAARARLHLPLHRRILLSAGWISARHKRMDYIIKEVASIEENRPFLLMLGAIDQESGAIKRLAGEILKPDDYLITSVPPDQMQHYYLASDLFALASLNEGFGRVFVEALSYGLQVFAHKFEVSEFVLGDAGTFGDFSKPNGLKQLIVSASDSTPDQAAHSWSTAERRFSWNKLTSSYFDMFHYAATSGGILRCPE